MPAFIFTILAAALMLLGYTPVMEEVLRALDIRGGCHQAHVMYLGISGLAVMGSFVAGVVYCFRLSRWNRWYTIALVAGILALPLFAGALLGQLAGS